MPELVIFEGSVPRPRRSLSTLWLSKLHNRPIHVDELAKKIAKQNVTENNSKKTCICSPTNHAGSFRCHLHRTMSPQQHHQWPQEDGGNDRELNSVNLDLPMYHKFASNKVPQLSRFGRAAIAGKN